MGKVRDGVGQGSKESTKNRTRDSGYTARGTVKEDRQRALDRWARGRGRIPLVT